MMSRKVSRRPALRLLDHQGQAQTPSSSDIATSNQFGASLGRERADYPAHGAAACYLT